MLIVMTKGRVDGGHNDGPYEEVISWNQNSTFSGCEGGCKETSITESEMGQASTIGDQISITYFSEECIEPSHSLSIPRLVV